MRIGTGLLLGLLTGLLWGTTDIAKSPPKSGITQPPDAATVIERLLAEDIDAHLDQATTLTYWLDQVKSGVPGFDPAHELLDPIRYWRGPVWAIVNWMTATGLIEHGETGLAERIRRDTQALIDQSDFREYFCPVTGRGGGGTDFSWTASMSLYWAARPESLPITAHLSQTGTAGQENT